MKIIIPALLALSLVAACREEDAQSVDPEARTLTDEATGYYCQMVLTGHPGPKAQVLLAGSIDPLWFAQVRDGLAYLKSPEKSGEILILYVNDMGQAQSWENPGDDNWINAAEAYFVLGSNAVGGMGAPEIVPFGQRKQAVDFAAENGGEVVRFEDIPTAAVLSPVDMQHGAEESDQ